MNRPAHAAPPRPSLTVREPLVLKALILAVVTAVANLAGYFAFDVPGDLLATVDGALTAGFAVLTWWGRKDLILPGVVSPATDARRSDSAFQSGASTNQAPEAFGIVVPSVEAQTWGTLLPKMEVDQ